MFDAIELGQLQNLLKVKNLDMVGGMGELNGTNDIKRMTTTPGSKVFLYVDKNGNTSDIGILDNAGTLTTVGKHHIGQLKTKETSKIIVADPDAEETAQIRPIDFTGEPTDASHFATDPQSKAEVKLLDQLMRSNIKAQSCNTMLLPGGRVALLCITAPVEEQEKKPTAKKTKKVIAKLLI